MSDELSEVRTFSAWMITVFTFDRAYKEVFPLA
jgi:hypothetical protein